MIEFDVLSERSDGTGRPDPRPRLQGTRRGPRRRLSQQGLAHLAAESFTGVELDLDLKLPGYELRALEALREFGLVERTLVSSQYVESLVALRAADPALRLGWSVPKVKRDYTHVTLHGAAGARRPPGLPPR